MIPERENENLQIHSVPSKILYQRNFSMAYNLCSIDNYVLLVLIEI